MSNNEFDRIVAAKLKEATFEYEPNDWDNLTMQLAAARRKKRAVLLWIYTASGIAAAILVGMVVLTPMLPNKTVAITAPQNKVRQVTPAPSLLSVTMNAQVQSTLKSSPVSNSATVMSAAKNNTTYSSVGIAHANPAIDHTATAPEIIHNTHIDSETNVVGVNQQKKDMPQEDRDKKNIQLDVTQPSGLPAIETEVVVVNKKISISVGGGVSYGTLNGGYALNAIADKKISNRMSFEVTMGYLNNTTTTITGAAGAYGLPPYSNVNTATNLKNTTNNATPLNYLQVAPVADYNISKKIVVGAGADVQRLLQDRDAIVVYDDKQKLAPLTDVGMLLKTDYAVSRRLKGGVSYRLGLNNVFAPNSNYIDRSYMQVQLKYRLHLER